MKLFNQFIAGFSCMVGLGSDGDFKINNYSVDFLNNPDTLKMRYADTFLTGNLLLPVQLSKDLTENNVLLLFNSGNNYYIFLNRAKKNNFLSPNDWGIQMKKYVDFSISDGRFSFSRFSKVDYYLPFLTGFYNSKDSIIITGSDLNRSDLEKMKEFQLNYFSTCDTLFKLNKNISVGKCLEDVLFELQIPNYFDQSNEVNLFLMEATNQIDNAWYNQYPAICTNNTVVVILSIEKNKITRIKYLNSDYIECIVRPNSFSTRDIHMH